MPLRDAICGHSVDATKISVAAHAMQAIEKCKGNKECIVDIWMKVLPDVEVPAAAHAAWLDISKAFAYRYWLFMGNTKASAAALARWNGAAAGAQVVALIGPALKLYCADSYIEGGCGAAGNYAGAKAGAAAGAAYCGFAGPVAPVCVYGVGIMGAKIGEFGAAGACAYLFEGPAKECYDATRAKVVPCQ